METVRHRDLDAYAKKLLDSLPTLEHATLLALSGALGAGKTTLVQALGRALGVTEKIPSPTFVLMRSYATKHPRFARLVHIDAYRIEGGDEVKVLGLGALCADPKNLVCIEWPERLWSERPEEAVAITLTNAGEDTRAIDCSC